jgi:hypothetical protein
VQSYLKVGEEEIIRLLQPDLTMKRIRSSLWNTYNKYSEYVMNRGFKKNQNEAITQDSICSGVCYPKYFSENILHNDLALAYIFTPPVSYEVMLEESLQLGYERIRKILEFPIYDEGGAPNTKVADIILKTVALLDLRFRGSVPQNINQRTVSVNVNKNTNTVNVSRETTTDQLDDALMSIEDLDQRINSIRLETKELLNAPSFTISEKNYIMIGSDRE